MEDQQRPPMDPELEALVSDMVSQARAEAWKIFATAPAALDLDELKSQALTGLAMAAARWPAYCEKNAYDPGCGQVPCAAPETCGTRFFAAYALRRIRGSMLDALRSNDYISRSVRGRSKQLREAQEAADHTLTEAELADRTGLTLAQVRETMAAAAARPASLEQYMTLPDSAVVIEPADERADIESAGGAGELVRAAMTAIRALPLRHQQVLALHFYGGMELPEVAELLEAGSREVSKIHDEAVAAVHGAMAKSAFGLA